MSNRADGSFRSRDHEFPRIKGSSFRLGRPDDFPSKLGSTSRNTVVFFFYWNVGISTSSGSLSTTTLVFVRSHDRIRTFFSLFFSRRNRGSDALSEIFTLGTGRTFLFFLFFSFFFHGDRFFSGIFCNPVEILVYRNERTIGEFFFLFFGNLRVSTFAGQQREVWKKRAFSRCKFSRVVIHYDRIGFESGIFAETRTNAGKLRFVRSFSFFSFSLLFFFCRPVAFTKRRTYVSVSGASMMFSRASRTHSVYISCFTFSSLVLLNFCRRGFFSADLDANESGQYSVSAFQWRLSRTERYKRFFPPPSFRFALFALIFGLRLYAVFRSTP